MRFPYYGHYAALFFLFVALILSQRRIEYGNEELEFLNGRSTNILLLTAHPDDECMFFGPAVLALTEKVRRIKELDGEHRHSVSSLCLSSGDSDGLGLIRKKELNASLDVLGVDKDRRWLLDKLFQDNITQFWNENLIAFNVASFVVDNDIDVILTFDNKGVSLHPNHISLYNGTVTLLYSLKELRPQLRAFSLTTVPLYRKYTGLISSFYCYLRHYYKYKTSGGDFIFTEGPVFISSWKEYFTTLRAMRKHKSQLVWFRWLYVLFSRYMWINEWQEIVV